MEKFSCHLIQVFIQTDRFKQHLLLFILWEYFNTRDFNKETNHHVKEKHHEKIVFDHILKQKWMSQY